MTPLRAPRQLAEYERTPPLVGGLRKFERFWLVCFAVGFAAVAVSAAVLAAVLSP